jgi:hypothetical protein
VVKDADTDTNVLVHRVETGLVVLTPGVARAWPVGDEKPPVSQGQQR